MWENWKYLLKLKKNFRKSEFIQGDKGDISHLSRLLNDSCVYHFKFISINTLTKRLKGLIKEIKERASFVKAYRCIR